MEDNNMETREDQPKNLAVEQTENQAGGDVRPVEESAEIQHEEDIIPDVKDLTEAESEAAYHGEEEAVSAEELDEDQETFEHAPVEKMLEVLKSVLRDDRIREFKKSFHHLRTRYKEIFEEERNIVFNQYVEEGGDPENFKFAPKALLSELKAVIQQYADKINDIRKREDQELQSNLLAKQDVIDEMKKLITEEQDIKKAFERFNELKTKWSVIGPVPSKYANDLWSTYKHFNDAFYDFVKINKELYEMDLKKNLELKRQLIRRVEGLVQIQSVKKSIELLHQIQKDWRETGPVPKAKSQEIFEQFKNAVDKIYSRRNEFLQERDEERNTNLVKKTAFCEKAEAIAAQEYPKLADWKKAEEVIKQLEEDWRTVGRVPAELNDSIWERFKAARKEFFKKRYILLKQISSEYESNLLAKEKLCEQAEAIMNETDWKETGNKLIRLQKEWKKIGPVERKRSDEIWARFRAACDQFFQQKEQHFASQGSREQENLEQKQAVIAEVEAFVPGEVLEENLAKVKDFQKAYGEIGFVPIKEKSKLDQHFNKAMDGLFEKLHIDKDKKHRVEYKMRIEGWLQQPNPLYQLRDERTFVMSKVKKLEEEILQIENNLGFFKNSKGTDAFKKQFEDKVEALRADLAIWEDKRNLLKNAIKALETK